MSQHNCVNHRTPCRLCGKDGDEVDMTSSPISMCSGHEGNNYVDFKRDNGLRLRIFQYDTATEESQKSPKKIFMCKGNYKSDALRLAASGNMVNEDGNITSTFVQWLHNMPATTTNTWDNQTGVEPLPEAVVKDIEAHLQQPQQRRSRRSYRREVDGQHYRIRITRTNMVTISLITAGEDSM
ncbi:unnamed protein product [Ceratitis capitata]|uniref:(Mediterranean fruit fly) hypothetical protein n=1 Tax=Ceratitis capitata TaxID=7213 RepID=A0A811UEK4_CERCA|nr:unnamed protein product [Ceratitis capitata]